MNPQVACLIAISLVLLPLAQATSLCPANNPHIGPYNRVEIVPKGYKLVDVEFTVKAVRVDGREETPLSSRPVKIYYYTADTRKTLIESGTTNRQGEYSYTPTKLGKYMVECAGKAPTFDVKRLLDDPTDFGAVCGNGICESDKMEDNENCPDDCTVCGNAICERDEDKENCPDDCIICGDGVCDDPEYSPDSCSCREDCIICGDGRCDLAHDEVCPEDCEDGEAKSNEEGGLESYWWIIIIVIIAVSFLVGKRRGEEEAPKAGKKPKNEKKAKKGKKSRAEDDEEIEEIILELMDSGVSDKRIKGKLKEFGLDAKEAKKLVEKAKKDRKWGKGC